jgi:cell division protein FtsI/penicillin-binding protein 2
MTPRQRFQAKKDKPDNYNRLRVVMAVVFLLVSAILLRLFNLQVSNHELYVALASSQQQISSELAPERGRIFLQDGKDMIGSDLYPIATNKDFGRIYAVPNKISDPDEIAEQVYELLDKERVQNEVEEMMARMDFGSSTINSMPVADNNETADFLEVKKELEIEARKKRIIKEYEKKFEKHLDPYEPLQSKVPDDVLKKLDELQLEGIDYVMEKHRYYPEGSIGSHILGFVGYNGDKRQGQYGLEGFFNHELAGEYGFLQAEKSGTGNLIILNDREYIAPKDGSDLILTINRSVQFTACKKLRETVSRLGADGGDVIVMEPFSGALLAMCSYPDYDPNEYNQVDSIQAYNNPAIFNAYEPGSIFKVFTMAAGLDEGKVTPRSTYEDKGQVMVEGWPKPIKNSDFETHGPHGRVTMVEVLSESLNTGTIHIMEKIGAPVFAEYVKQFGFGQKTGIELETEGSSNIASLDRQPIRPVEAATASFGQGITATPLQLVTAYSAIANGGFLMKPYLVGKIVSGEDQIQVTEPRQIRRVISERTSMLLSGMMVNVVDDGHAKLASVDGYYVAGKTGTAQVASREKRGYGEATIHSFAGFAPVEEPKFVMLIRLNNPKGIEYSASTAAPLFGELAEFILNYYEVPKER